MATDSIGYCVLDCIVIGGGISGLTTLHFLRKEANLNVYIVEKEDRTGGRTSSGEFQGWHYAKGTEYLGEPDSTYRRLVDDFKLDMKFIPEPMDSMFRQPDLCLNGDQISRHLAEKTSLAQFNKFVALVQKLGDEYEEVPWTRECDLMPLDKVTARQWFQTNGFDANYQEKYNVSARGLFGANMDELSALSYIPEIAFDYEDDKPRRNMNDFDTDKEMAGKNSDAYTCIGGLTSVIQAMHAAYADCIFTGETVVRVSHHGKLFTTVCASGRTFESKAVVFSTPAPITLILGATVLSEKQRDLLQQVPYSPFTTVTLATRVPIWTHSFDCALPDDFYFTDIYNATYVQEYYTHSKPDGFYLSSIYIAGRNMHDHTIVKDSDQTIIDKCLRDINKLPNVHCQLEDILHADINRMVLGYPVMTLGAYGRLIRLHQMTNGAIGLAGDYMIYPTFEAAMQSGQMASRKIMTYLGKKWTRKDDYSDSSSSSSNDEKKT